MKRILPLAISIFMLLSCVESEEPNSATSDKFKVKAINYIADNEVMYVILHDSIGTALGFHQIHNGETVEFDVDKSKDYFVSTYTIREGEYGLQEYMSTFTNRDLTFDMILEIGESTAPVQTGTFKVRANDNDEPIGVFVTAKDWISDFSVSTNLYDENAKLFSGVNRYMVIANQGTERRFSYIDNPQKDKTYTLQYDQMQAFDIILEVPNLDYYYFNYNIKSLEERNGKIYPNFIFGNYGYYNSQKEKFQLLYTSEIKKYSTNITINKASYPNVSFIYSKIGSPPSQISFLDLKEIKIAKNSISDFQFESTVEDAEYYSVGFQSSKSVSNGLPSSRSFSWSINGLATSFSLTVPEELVTAHPFFLSDFSHLFLSNAGISKKLIETKSSGEIEIENFTILQFFDN